MNVIMKLKHLNIIIVSLLSVFGLISCREENPLSFGDVTGIYFNNRSAGNLTDTTAYTFVYESKDRLTVPVKVQLLGKPADRDRVVDIQASSENAVENTDYILPSEAVLPKGEVSFDYEVVLLRTDALKEGTKSLLLTIRENENFRTPISEMAAASGNVSTLDFRIDFTDTFSEPPATWEDELLGDFSQQKFELICKVVEGVEPSDFNDSEKMGLSRISFISSEIRQYVKEEYEKKQAGEKYDTDIIDKTTGEPLSFEKTL